MYSAQLDVIGFCSSSFENVLKDVVVSWSVLDDVTAFSGKKFVNEKNLVCC